MILVILMFNIYSPYTVNDEAALLSNTFSVIYVDNGADSILIPKDSYIYRGFRSAGYGEYRRFMEKLNR